AVVTRSRARRRGAARSWDPRFCGDCRHYVPVEPSENALDEAACAMATAPTRETRPRRELLDEQSADMLEPHGFDGEAARCQKSSQLALGKAVLIERGPLGGIAIAAQARFRPAD